MGPIKKRQTRATALDGRPDKPQNSNSLPITRLCTALCAPVFAVCLPTTLAAQELTLGLGATGYVNTGTNSAAFEVEYCHAAFAQRRVVTLAWGGANASVSGEGDFFAGAGLWAHWQWDIGWFIDSSVVPGVYDAGTDGNDLGSTLEIRSLLGVGHSLGNGRAISIAASHKSTPVRQMRTPAPTLT